MAREDEQRLKDLLRNIETGDIPEDLPDPEEYDDMGGIKSLDRGAPSIKMASETPEEEFELEIFMMLQEFEDAKKNGYGGSLEDFSKEYFTKRKMKKEEDRKMAMYGGRMQYAEAGRAYEEVIDKNAEEEYYRKKAIELDKKYNPQNYFNEKKSTYKQMENALEKMGPKKIKPIANKPEEDIPTRLSRLDAEKRLQDILKKQLEEKAKKAKGGIAGVL